MFVFYFLVILVAVLVWLLLSGVYRPLGRLAHRIWKDVRDNMDDENESSTLSNDKSHNNDSTSIKGDF